MTRTIWRYDFRVDGEAYLDMPRGAELLPRIERSDRLPSHIGLTVWALVDPDAPPTTRLLRIAGTGHPLPDGLLRYVGTVPLPEALWFHVFDMGEVRPRKDTP